VVWVSAGADRATLWHNSLVLAAPMLVSPASELPAGEEWAFEVKWDGMRALISVDPAIRVHSRHGQDHTAAFPELAVLESLAQRAKVVLDGELVCLDPATGRPSFERLMARTQSKLPLTAARQAPVTFMAFDVLTVDAIDMCGCPWAKRRRTLEELHAQAPDDIWRVNTAFADGPGLLAATAGMGLEGVVAKRVTSRYWPGRRTPYWRKVKNRSFEWFELLGWRAPAGRDPGGLLAGRAGRVIACAFPALASAERGRFAALVGEHGVEVPGGVRLAAGRAEIEVGYLERLPAGRLREPVARAVRAVGS
jgi:bifunctional non-homologous end joining protein LigD